MPPKYIIYWKKTHFVEFKCIITITIIVTMIIIIIIIIIIDLLALY